MAERRELQFFMLRRQYVQDDSYPFPKQALVLTCQQYKCFKNTAGKGEIARNELRVLSTRLETFIPFSQVRNCRLQALLVRKSLIKFIV